MNNELLKEVLVSTGEVKVSSNSSVFTSTGIGSCVVVFVYDRNKKNGGVAHIMVPGNESVKVVPKRAMYANTAVTSLIELLEKSGSERSQLKAKIVGGANMFDWSDAEDMRNLGKYNIEQVKKELVKNKIYMAAEEIGGTSGKTVKCYTDTGEVHIRLDKNNVKII